MHLVDTSVIPYCAGSRTRSCTAWRVSSPPPQGPSLGSGLYCPGPSSLNRPHPSRSRAHHDFTAWRLIRNAFAVRERLGDPRAVPGFRCTFRPGIAVLSDPGELSIDNFQHVDVDFGLRRILSGSALPNIPQSVSRGGRAFGASLVCFRYGLSGCLPPCMDLTGTPSHRGLLLPGFQRIGLPPRCWI